MITVEDHFKHGGLGDAVLNAVQGNGIDVKKLAVSKISHSGHMEELLADAGIDANHIVERVKSLL